MDDEWADCAILGCKSKACLRFNSPLCMPHLVESLRERIKELEIYKSNYEAMQRVEEDLE